MVPFSSLQEYCLLLDADEDIQTLCTKCNIKPNEPIEYHSFLLLLTLLSTNIFNKHNNNIPNELTYATIYLSKDLPNLTLPHNEDNNNNDSSSILLNTSMQSNDNNDGNNNSTVFESPSKSLLIGNSSVDLSFNEDNEIEYTCDSLNLVYNIYFIFLFSI